MSVFTEISLIFGIVLIVSAVMRILKQPLIIGYILAGIIVGPYFLGVLQSTEIVEVFSKLGITALLFIVGIGLNPKLIKEFGLVSLVVGVGQVLFTSIFGYLLGKFLGFENIEAVYIAVALTFSSTIIILKLLTDRGDVNNLYGRISIGLLLVQDLIAAIILVIIASLNNATPGASLVFETSFVLFKGFALLLVLFAISTYILPKLNKFVADSQEFLFIAALAWGIGVAALYSVLGLSIEIGALVAGITLSTTPYSHEIASRFRPLRDFFIILFFILLGSNMVIADWQTLMLPALAFSAFVLIGNPLIVFMLMNLFGYTKRTGFKAGLAVAQISEFSLILIALGFDIGHLSLNVMSMVTLVGIITIAGSTYLILYADAIYKKLEGVLSFFELKKLDKRKKESTLIPFDAVIFGYRRVGAEFMHAFNELGSKFLAVDFNPLVIEQLEKRGIPCMYGDADDIEFLQELPLREVKMVVSTIPEFETNRMIIRHMEKINPEAIIVIVTDNLEHAEILYEEGATHVILPHYIGAHSISQIILENEYDFEKHANLRENHKSHLERLKQISIEDKVL